jgi:hypothetical protein
VLVAISDRLAVDSAHLGLFSAWDSIDYSWARLNRVATTASIPVFSQHVADQFGLIPARARHNT